MAKRIKTNDFVSVIVAIGSFVALIIIIFLTMIKLSFRIILFIYDVITIYTSKYRVKSGNGFFKTYFNKGNYGEFILYRKIVKKFGNENVYTNVYLNNVNTDYTEIDVIALSEHGIYVFEMKNYSGYIYGSENDEYWTQVLNRFSKHKFYNPLRQNFAHTKAIEKYLELKENEIIPVVVFSNHSKFSKLDVSMDKNIIKIKDVIRFINYNFKNNEVIISENSIKDFSVKLIDRSNMSQEIKNIHIEQVMSIQTNSELKNINPEN